MRTGWWNRLGLAAALGLTVGASSGLTAGCAREAEPISTVGLNYTRKVDLVGADAKNPTEWYMRMTVTDTGRTNHFAFPGLQDELRRVRWEVQERFLVARRSYELVAGTDGKGADPSKVDGVIVAMFPIQAHFDIRRAYNPGTGEELNTLVENMTDRAWHDRDYMRVDWTKNLVTDPDFQGFWIAEMFGDIRWEPVQYFEQDPKSENAPVYDTANGYMDVTSKWFAHTEDFYGIKGLPACWIYNYFTGSDVRDCNAQEVAIRTSFMKVGDRDYEAAETNSEKFSLFGTFNRDRYGFSGQYEILDKHWHRLMGRQNLWAKSHDDRSCFEAQKGDRPEADKFCSSVKGSVCDPYAAKCTLPYKDRPVRTIPYFVSRSMPTDLWAENQALVDQWNDALKGAIAAAREVECAKGGDKAACRAEFWDGETAKVADEALVLCHNPSLATDPKACGKAGTIAREGDLRYNMIAWVDQPLMSAPLGYGPNGADPITGEVVQSTSYIYGASIDSYSAMARDLVSIALGDVSVEDFAKGKHVDGNLGQISSPSGKEGIYQAYATVLNGKKRESELAGLDALEISKRINGLEPERFVAGLGAAAAVGDKATPAARLAAVQALIADKGAKGAVGFGGRAEAEANLKSLSARLAGGKTEAALIDTQDYVNANAIAAVTNNDQAKQLAKLASPFGGVLGPMQLAEMQKKISGELERRGVCMFGMSEFNAPHLEGLARKLIAKYKGVPKEERSLAVFKELRGLIYRAVTEHEVGHNMALRHNFQGSWDSMNFHPNYWKLRTNDGKSTAACAAPRSDVKSDTCMGPRYLDPETNEEQGANNPHPALEEYAYSSIMDYGYDFNTDLVGIGSYDRAAMKFIYGGVVEVLPASSNVAKQIAPIHSNPLTEQWMVKRNDPTMGDAVQPTHYTSLARILQNEKLIFDATRCRAPKTPAEEYAAIDGKVCTDAIKEHASVRDMVSGPLKGIDDNMSAPLWRSTDGRIRWPYRFGTDEYANTPHGMRFDAGADIYEAAANVGKLYEYRYILDYFRRGRRGWLTWSASSRIWDRYFSRMHSFGWLATSKLGMYAAMYPDKKVTENPAINSDDWGRGYSLALTTLFESIEKAVLRPQPGQYGLKSAVEGQTKDVYEVPDNDDGKLFKVSILDGRWIDDDLDNLKGGSFNYQAYHDRMGTYAEKPIAVAALAVQFPPVHVYSKDTYVDGRNMLLNFRTMMPTAYDRLMGSLMAFDTDAISPWIDRAEKKDSFGNSNVHFPKLWEKDFKVTGSDPVHVDALLGFRLQVPALVYSFIYGQEDSSQSLQNSLRVWVEGGPEALPLSEKEKAYLYEPDSGNLWATRDSGMQMDNGVSRPVGIGHRMVMHANQLLAGGYKVQVDATGMPLYDAVTHRPKWEVGATPGEVKDADKAQTFRRYIGILNVLRQYIWEERGNLKF